MDVIEAEMVLFKIARKHSQDHEAYKVNNQKDLRASLARRIMTEAREMYPDVSAETWAKAAKKMHERMAY